jgi:hypothetical protein
VLVASHGGPCVDDQLQRERLRDCRAVARQLIAQILETATYYLGALVAAARPNGDPDQPGPSPCHRPPPTGFRSDRFDLAGPLQSGDRRSRIDGDSVRQVGAVKAGRAHPDEQLISRRDRRLDVPQSH